MGARPPASPPNEEASKQGQGQTGRRRRKRRKRQMRAAERETEKEREERRIAFEDEQASERASELRKRPRCRRVISGNQNKCTPRRSEANDLKWVPTTYAILLQK